MKYRRLGASGLKVSEICLGAWINFGERIDDPQTFAVVDAAVEAGIDFFDTADVYAGGKAEEVMGRWMQGKDRRTFTIATKCRGRMWPGSNGEGLSRKHIFDACHDSLRRLQTDYIDLYQVHWPDPETSLLETMSALDDLVKQGKVRYIGCSNFGSELIGEAARISEMYHLNKFISSQFKAKSCRSSLTLTIDRSTCGSFRPFIPSTSCRGVGLDLLTDGAGVGLWGLGVDGHHRIRAKRFDQSRQVRRRGVP